MLKVGFWSCGIEVWFLHSVGLWWFEVVLKKPSTSQWNVPSLLTYLKWYTPSTYWSPSQVSHGMGTIVWLLILTATRVLYPNRFLLLSTGEVGASDRWRAVAASRRGAAQVPQQHAVTVSHRHLPDSYLPLHRRLCPDSHTYCCVVVDSHTHCCQRIVRRHHVFMIYGCREAIFTLCFNVFIVKCHLDLITDF